VLCDGHPAFINCSRQNVVDRILRAVALNEVVVEIQETVAADEEVKEACKPAQTGRIFDRFGQFCCGRRPGSARSYADFIKSTSGR